MSNLLQDINISMCLMTIHPLVQELSFFFFFFFSFGGRGGGGGGAALAGCYIRISMQVQCMAGIMPKV